MTSVSSFSYIAISSLFFCYIAISFPVQAQIASDNSISIPTNVERLEKIWKITQGTEAGINLFHSFAEFSVIDGNTALFINNNPTIQNVISRVTGASDSKIFGKIEAGGSAPNFNLFLLNPNGIIFGPNASLDLKGSFLATTANAIQFGDRGFFSASTPNDPSLLTVQPSAFFVNQVRPSSIRYQSNNQPVMGLKVPDNKSLLLLGGDITTDGGRLTAPNGHIELGGLAESGIVALNTSGNNLSLSFPDSVVRADVLLTNGSRVDVTDKGSGSIVINAQNIEISGLSFLSGGIASNMKSTGSESGDISLHATEAVNLNFSAIVNRTRPGTSTVTIGNSGGILINSKSLSLLNGAEIFTLSEGQGNSGDLTLNIRNHISLSGISEQGLPSSIGSGVGAINPAAAGKSGDIKVTAGSLSLSDGAIIRSSVLGKGNTGDIFIRVNGLVSLENTTLQRNNSQIRTLVEPGAVGNGGNIDIQAKSLSLKGGSRLDAFVSRAEEGFPGGKGNGGDIIVRTSDSVNISGVGINGESSGIFASTQNGAEGRAGNITVNTPAFRITDGAAVTAQTDNSGFGGNIKIDSNTFEAINGGQLITTTSSSGNAGSINVNATDRVILSGNDHTFDERIANFGTDIVGNAGAASGLFAESTGAGLAGNITLETGRLAISNGAIVSVKSPKGQAGSISIKANSLTLNRGTITAETGKSGVAEGANITLQIRDLLSLQNESLISATAFGSAKGGNILIDPTFVLVFPSTGPNGSDIVARAVQGNGGNITIDAQGIFGTAVRKDHNPDGSNDIDANSEFGPPGQVQLTSTVDPNQGVAQIPETVVDPNALVSQSPCKRGSQSQFTRTGRGGLPPNLSDDLSGESTQVGLVKPAPSIVAEGQAQRTSSDVAPNENQKSKVENPIVPAQGWTFKDNGEVVLTAYNPSVTGPQRLKENPVGCPAF